MIIFNKEYDSESLSDLDRDIYEAINGIDVEQDEHGFHTGTYVVQIVYNEED